jgi:hypothetical protein
MRHKPSLTPTARLILAAVSASTAPLSVAKLAEATCASPYTVLELTRELRRSGHLTACVVDGVTHYVPSAAPTEAVQQ